ncbi:DUF3149 domain-containing protein [Dyella choica]|uniref:DUF3149 domain-containing protein n=1 Tax=Dyella choica TaxID=1927959 RepID=A0A3S0PIH1_9GAMM|nr:DUF3149 domain-containing protein [Dyella choica]RUL75340.1 DUF3149 domain-containing protein [Dyella choica]
MIIWGTRGKNAALHVVEHRDCKTCEKNQPFRLMLQYQYSHLYYVFRWVTKKQYFLACDICKRGWTLDAKKVEADFKQKQKPHPIPFGDRYGWAALLVIVALIGIMAQFSHPA